LPYALERRALFFGAFTGAGLLRRDPPDRYVFNYGASYAEETDAVVRYLVKMRGLRPEQIAVFAQQDAYGDSGFAGVAKAMRALRGGNEGAILRLDYKRNTVDVDDAVARLRAHKLPMKAGVTVGAYRVLTQIDLADGVCVTLIVNRPAGLALGQRAAAMADKVCSHRRQEESNRCRFGHVTL
jgi:Periplasmic binding protein